LRRGNVFFLLLYGTIFALLNISYILSSQKYIRGLFTRVTASSGGNVTDWVYQKIHKRGKMEKVSLMRHCSHKLNSGELNEIIRTLVSGGMIESKYVEGSNKVLYVDRRRGS
jgi:hypothetical protein